MNFLPCILSLFILGGLHAQIPTVPTLSIRSEILEEDRYYQVQLPTSYTEDEYYQQKHYPLLIVLDGDRLLPLVEQIVHTTSHGSVEQVPEMIVVGISNTDRNRDFRPPYGEIRNALNGPERFLQFLREELIPRIANDYRVTYCSYLLGHSFAGLFVADAWLSNAGFCGYLAIDPSLGWANSGIVDKLNLYVPEGPFPAGDLYIGQASNPFNPGPATNPNGQAIQDIRAVLSDHESIGFQHEFFPDEDHFSIPLLATYQGLRYLFRNYLPPLGQIKEKPIQELIKNFSTSGAVHPSSSIPGLEAQPSIQPPAKVLHQVARFLYHQEEEPLIAYQLLDWLLKEYPGAEPIRATWRTFREELLRQGLLSN